MLVVPDSDGDCLGPLLQLAQQLAQTPEARSIILPLGSMARVEEAIRSRPSLPDDGRSRSKSSIKCGTVVQRARFWAPATNCFEDTLDYLVAHEILSPDEDATATTFRLPNGQRHTAPVVDPFGPGRRVVILTHHVRQELRNVRNAEDVPWWKTGFGYVHQGGRIALGAFGLGGLGDQLGEVWKEQGWLPPEEGEEEDGELSDERERDERKSQQRQPQQRRPTQQEQRRQRAKQRAQQEEQERRRRREERLERARQRTRSPARRRPQDDDGGTYGQRYEEED